jgi:hypothetical protein
MGTEAVGEIQAVEGVTSQEVEGMLRGQSQGGEGGGGLEGSGPR